jgi:hypothetical protein
MAIALARADAKASASLLIDAIGFDARTQSVILNRLPH